MGSHTVDGLGIVVRLLLLAVLVGNCISIGGLFRGRRLSLC